VNWLWPIHSATVTVSPTNWYRFSELVPVLVLSYRSPHLQVDDLGAPAARRVDVPGHDMTVLRDSPRRIDDEDRSFDAVLVLAPLSLVSDVARSLRIYIQVKLHSRWNIPTGFIYTLAAR